MLKGNGVTNGASPQPSTGLGSDVETVDALLMAIKNLVSNSATRVDKTSVSDDKTYHVDDENLFENYSKGTIKEEDSQDLIDEKLRLDEMERFATDISMRAASLKNSVLGLLRKSVGGDSGVSSNNITSAELKERIATLESELEATDSKFEEMAQARNEATASERRVRRGLYRLASGRMTMEDVLKAVEKEDNGVSFMETLAALDGANETKSSSSPTAATSSTVLSSPGTAASKDSGVSSEEVAQLKKHVQDIQVVAETREKKIAEVRYSVILLHLVCRSICRSFSHWHPSMFTPSTASNRKRRTTKTYQLIASPQREQQRRT